MMDTLIQFDNTYARELEGMYVPWQPTPVPSPKLLRLNTDLGIQLGLPIEILNGPAGSAFLSGNETLVGATPIAQVYAGHQFGHFAPRLGDGRALLLGEVVDKDGLRRDLALKGSGPTPFSRGGDGKAAVGPVLREYLIGEFMHAMGIPTTRALAAVWTGESVFRERPLPGAVLTRVAASHLRIGTVEFFAAREEPHQVQRLVDYAIRRHDPQLADHPHRYQEWFRAVADRQASLVAHWMLVGFIHGVMNTDNTTISGETIDYGPCAFMEAYDPHAVFSSIDTQGRYAYHNQPHIIRWNLARLAGAIAPVMTNGSRESKVAPFLEILETFPARYYDYWLAGIRKKLGLATTEEGDDVLANEWLALLHARGADYTLAWRYLVDAAEGNDRPLQAVFREPSALAMWLRQWRMRLDRESLKTEARAAAMRRVNPLYIPRNHRVEEALAAATDNTDLAPFERLLKAVTRPFDEDPELDAYATPAPAEVTACYQTFCGT
ncbi:MAG: YdiU family protein [Nitrospira sp.]|jgi:uncharacterized protein YdiU (UPF0061 family)|uniref:protein adenylyltransferase SelO n=1 Tax=Nitrospira sp. KM1 TaxID=1936990 RepID=UPI001564FD7A|nr:YdiU family protein [Nitrospira sp. KM1]MBS0156303.1 YdiU family protein [Nitrospira sp.]MBS0165342.1 YdiU family protein [Nitrospira sp.]